ncbi:MAG: WYL domain-containing protein [Burkholderiaceae bacterium]|nr:WYL domain-containing protein [Burkholderiaceae bacterium]
MAQAERLQKIHRWLAAGRCVPRERMLNELEVSYSTLKRDIAFLRDRFHIPIVWVAQLRGWQIDKQCSGSQHEVPGLWLSSEEIHALLTMQHLLSALDAGRLLQPHVSALQRCLRQVLESGAALDAHVERRIRILPMSARRIDLPQFQVVGSALAHCRRLRIRYHARSDDQVSEREVSPQRLVHYRDNWYLDAWCHWREGLRSFSIDAIKDARLLEQPAIELAETELDAELGAGYGIFSGKAVQTAQLRFARRSARWVAAERWHPNQIGRWDHQGRWLLSVPFADPRELVRDILRHVPDVEVLAPDELRDEVLRRLADGVRGMTG